MADDWQSTFAVYLSIATAAFSGYQWWNTEREQRVNTAIDISRKFIEDNKEIDDVHLMSLYSDPSELKKQFSDEETRKVLRIMLQMDYIAKLINENKIDPNYVSPSLKCFVAMADRASATSIKKGMSMPTPEAHRLTASFDTSICSSF